MHLKDQLVFTTIVFMFYFGKMLKCEAQRAQNIKKKKFTLIKKQRDWQKSKRTEKTQACPQQPQI